MRSIGITIDADRQLKRGDFGASLQGRTLRVPVPVGEALAAVQAHTAEEFCAYLVSFPEGLAKLLGWSLPDLLRARRRLARTLGNAVNPGCLKRPRPRHRIYGAMKPPHVTA